jgi:hypothetical protein
MVMAIYRHFGEASFEPADIACMGAAYEAALVSLGLPDRNDPVSELVAAKIIEIFRTGECDSSKLCASALQQLGVPQAG